ncbi:30S ribosomal protein S16 [Thermoproteota archaeon]
MELRIRMKKISSTSKKRYNFRIVAIGRAKARDARPAEEVGFYDPSKKPAVVRFKQERYDYWVSKGAQPSSTVASLYKRYKKSQ